ncbi:MAG: hypothetical protein HC769_13395 [Cyanobacteria bacterium CRU_2_1]|nr:hypothetical protein [Cyanobacteria bacterium RU_5_0]NJR59743.1 hypothetical protein [Cyanobacteria bacterium CRU_2_1]
MGDSSLIYAPRHAALGIVPYGRLVIATIAPPYDQAYWLWSQYPGGLDGY